MTNDQGQTNKANDHVTRDERARRRGGLVAPIRREVRSQLGQAGNEMLQIDIGDFVIYADQLQVGEVYVEPDPNAPNDATRTIEHWCLYERYVAPNSEGAVTLRFEYGGTYTVLEDYLAHIRGIADSRYIKAVCAELHP